MIKAIVLTYDKYHQFADHMIRCYLDVWPSHPFEFRIPYQKFPHSLVEKFGGLIDPIASPPGIKQTVLSLISDLPDEEWIFWCIDDKYPLKINEEIANQCVDWLEHFNDVNECGLLFCRCRKLLNRENIRVGTEVESMWGTKAVERKNYYQFWIPQFMRVKVLRDLFESFPDFNFSAKEMDTFTGQEEHLDVKEFRSDQKMYVTLTNCAQYGESTTSGKITANCLESMQKKEMDTGGFGISTRTIIMGEL